MNKINNSVDEFVRTSFNKDGSIVDSSGLDDCFVFFDITIPIIPILLPL